ncbi:MAG: hypothetical protein WA985_06755 [Erythrobacter sp.]
MKACLLHAAGAIALTFGLAACIPSSERPEPAPAPVAMPAPDPAPPTAPPPVMQQPEYDDYLDAPQTAGTWTYVDEPAESLAVFGTGMDNAVFIMRCDKANRQVGLGRVSSQTGTPAMEITTETRTNTLSTRSRGPSLVAADLAPADPLLDAMAVTKGRFAVAVAGERTLYLPAWAEVTRVIEDCR